MLRLNALLFLNLSSSFWPFASGRVTKEGGTCSPSVRLTLRIRLRRIAAMSCAVGVFGVIGVGGHDNDGDGRSKDPLSGVGEQGTEFAADGMTLIQSGLGSTLCAFLLVLSLSGLLPPSDDDMESNENRDGSSVLMCILLFRLNFLCACAGTSPRTNGVDPSMAPNFLVDRMSCARECAGRVCV